MSLEKYRQKRNFHKTPEPPGEAGSSISGRTYCIQKHAASRLHYDLRLELDGVLKSWAVPKGPCLDPAEKRLAVHVEDHPLDYGSFEGIIPEGEYGGGTVMLWDRGQWEPIGNPHQGYADGHLKFRLHGEKLRGGWTLVRLKAQEEENGDKNWLLIKERDEESRPLAEIDITDAEPLSVASGQNLEEIAASENLRVWSNEDEENPAGQDNKAKKTGAGHPKPLSLDLAAVPKARLAPQPEMQYPQLAKLVKTPPQGDNWLHEIKFDGYRLVAVIKDRNIRLFTRHGKDWTAKFESIRAALAALPVKQAILDGEVVVLDEKGISHFQALQNYLEGGAAQLIYFVFDLTYCDGYDLTRVPLLTRKELLRQILAASGDRAPSIRFGDHLQGKGQAFYESACEHGLEGVVSKRADSPYEPRRTSSWLKIKCLLRQEFVVGGYTDPSGSRPGFGALVLGYYDDQGRLVYCGRVGTGFTQKLLQQILKELKARHQVKTPFDVPPAGREARGVHWIKPELVAEVAFSDWTDEGILRHPSFQGLRWDKNPREVRREEPEPTARVAGEKPGPEPQKKEDRRLAGVKLSNPDRILYPAQGLTKEALADYYEMVADRILPHIVKRPLMVLRCPLGHEEECFYQKHLNETFPKEVHGVPIEEDGQIQLYIAIKDIKGLFSLVQLGVLEIHPWASPEADIEKPDRVIFDLDPGPKVEWPAVIEAAQILRDRLSRLGLQSFVKTSGGKGLHIFVPIQQRTGWKETKDFARAVAEAMVQQNPKKYIATMSLAKRHGKIFVDYLRTGRGSTCVAPYSTRARPGAPVSTPLTWEELADVAGPAQFTVENLSARLARLRHDPWEEFFKVKQSLPI
ncbi:MAG: DNA ligase D [Deltaproteobacteria bacterium]|nr:DNA ligase D [Deltaproteobacteria bacterium]